MPFGVYVHIPFCRKKCPYCSFTSFENRTDIFKSYTNSLIREYTLRLKAPFEGIPDTLYIGGGTPSVFPYEYIDIISKTVGPVKKEFTIEVNPESLNEKWLNGVLLSGATRISVGIQSFDDKVLKTLGRIHSVDNAVRALKTIRKAGIVNISIDLMFGIPGQNINSWEKTLEQTVVLSPEHVSCYSLGIEEDTDYFKTFGGEVISPDESETAEMYLCAINVLENHGIMQYEISNFARPGFESVHNRSYWNFTPYLGIGASSHSFDGSVRSWNTNDVTEYIRRAHENGNVTDDEEIIYGKTRLTEELMLSLRTTEGFDLSGFIDKKLTDLPGLRKKMELFEKMGLMYINDSGKNNLTRNGFLVSNELMSELLTYI